jgi:hypothetical protein
MRGDESKGQLPIDDWLDSQQKIYFGCTHPTAVVVGEARILVAQL